MMEMKNVSDATIDAALAGDKEAMAALLESVQDGIYNLSLRMLGLPGDAQDATQEIFIRIMTGLSGFRRESRFSTWVYRIAINHLLDYKKSMFAQRPLSFAFYGADIAGADLAGYPAPEGVDEALLAEELKMSCTNVMLQCFDAQTRIIYILGTMFRMDSGVSAQLLGMTPEAYRQRLSRARAKMADFLGEYCGLGGSGKCDCKKRIGYAAANRRIDPAHMAFTSLERMGQVKDAMEGMDEKSQVFAGLPGYRAPGQVQGFLRELLASGEMRTITAEGRG